ncbi:phosphopantetheine-binding protein [Bacillus licheniformis]|nr:phosphopantetheine-binding protein [Bacillus licheniformis]
MADIWQDVLGIDRIGVTDNFFALGGDSIKGIQMASRLQQHGWKLEMKDLFQHPTIGELSSYVQAADAKPIDQGPVEGEVTLTPISAGSSNGNLRTSITGISRSCFTPLQGLTRSSSNRHWRH